MNLWSTVVCLCLLFGVLEARGRTPKKINKHNITRCDQLPKVVNSNFIVGSPFHVYYALDPTYNCTTAYALSQVGPSGANKAIFVILQGYEVKTAFSVQLNGTTSYTYTCDEDEEIIYYFLMYNVTDTYQIICPYSCSTDGITLTILRCYGHTQQDQMQMKKVLDEYLPGVPGGENLVYTQRNCPQSRSCQNYVFN